MVSALTMLWNSVCTTTSNSIESINSFAPVAELVDAPDLGSGVLRRAGSSPVRRTTFSSKWLIIRCVFVESSKIVNQLSTENLYLFN